MATRAQAKTTTTEKAAQAAHEAVDKMAAKAERAEVGARGKVDDVEDTLRDSAELAQAKGRELVSGVSGYVHEHPVQSLAVAFVAGIVVSSLLRR